MKKTTVMILCCTLIFVSADTINNTKSKDTTTSEAIINKAMKVRVLPITTPSPIESSTLPPEASTTTEKATITEKETATEKLNTTEKIITTEKSTTTTTTSTPDITTSTTIKASIPIATPVPDPQVRKWVVNGTNSTILVQMAANLVIMAYNESKLINVPVDNNTQVSGNFSEYDESMTLSWNSSGTLNNSIILHFKQDSNNQTYVLSGLEVLLAPEEIPNYNSSSVLKLVHTKNHFNTSTGNSYRCLRLQIFNLTMENEKGVIGQMKVSNLRFQAFKTDKKDAFGLAEDCAYDTPDAVPIAVGCILAALVVIVLCAYLFSRRRTQSRGYLSM